MYPTICSTQSSAPHRTACATPLAPQHPPWTAARCVLARVVAMSVPVVPAHRSGFCLPQVIYRPCLLDPISWTKTGPNFCNSCGTHCKIAQYCPPGGRPQKLTPMRRLVWAPQNCFQKWGPENGTQKWYAKSEATQCGFTFCVPLLSATFRTSFFKKFSAPQKIPKPDLKKWPKSVARTAPKFENKQSIPARMAQTLQSDSTSLL